MGTGTPDIIYNYFIDFQTKSQHYISLCRFSGSGTFTRAWYPPAGHTNKRATKRAAFLSFLSGKAQANAALLHLFMI